MFGLSIGRVRGRSMLPRITPDSFIIAINYPPFLPKRVGQMYYLSHPRYGRIVKTLAAIEGENLWFRGESPESVSTQAIGALQQQHIIGRVIWVIAA